MKQLFQKKKTKTRPASAKKTARGACAALGALLLPVLAGAGLSAWDAARGFGGFGPLWPALAGVAAYGACQLILPRPITLYVFGHELTHALAALLSGYRVRSFSVSSRGGEVTLSGSNAAVALAPYCVPIYTVIAGAAFRVADHFFPFAHAGLWFAAALGFTFAFHAALTVYALSQRQPDLDYVGPFLSLVLILLANCLALVLLLKLVYPAGVSLRLFAAHWAADSLWMFDRIITSVFFLCGQAAGLLREAGILDRARDILHSAGQAWTR